MYDGSGVTGAFTLPYHKDAPDQQSVSWLEMVEGMSLAVFTLSHLKTTLR